VALRHTAVAVGSMLLVAAGSLVGGPAAQATVTTFNDGVLIYKVGDPGEVSIGDGLVDACVTTCAANLGVGIDGSGVLTLPSQVSDGFLTYNVTEISDRAFSDWAGIFGVTIPGTVRRVGNQAFYRGTPGTGLSSLTIEPGVDLTIGPMAFAGTALTHLDIPSRVRTIQNGAFVDVPDLQTIEINGGNSPASIETLGTRVRIRTWTTCGSAGSSQPLPTVHSTATSAVNFATNQPQPVGPRHLRRCPTAPGSQLTLRQSLPRPQTPPRASETPRRPSVSRRPEMVSCTTSGSATVLASRARTAPPSQSRTRR